MRNDSTESVQCHSFLLNQQYGASPFLSELKSLFSKPFHRVCSHIIRTVDGFQLCYAAKTWHGGFVGMMIFGASEVSGNVDLGDETTTMMCKFVVRASEASITKQIESDLQGWCDDITDGGVEYIPEDEVKATAAEKLKISMKKKKKKKKKTWRFTVLQEWHMLCKDRKYTKKLTKQASERL